MSQAPTSSEVAAGQASTLGGAKQAAVGPKAPVAERKWAAPVFGALGILMALVVWDMLSRTGFVAPQDLPPVRAVLTAFIDLLQTSELWADIGHTLTTWGIGLLISSAIGIPVGLLLGSSWALWRSLRPTVEFLRAVPGVSLVPVAIILWGQAVKGNVALIVFGSIWVILINALYGARAIDEVAKDTAKAFGLNRWERISSLVIPGASPYLATGVRIGSAAALITAVTAELVIGTPGLGSAIAKAQLAGATEKMYGLILATGFVGVATHVALQAVEERVLRWHIQRQKVG